MNRFIVLTVLTVVALLVSSVNAQSFSRAALDGNWVVSYLEKDGKPVDRATVENFSSMTFAHESRVEIVRQDDGNRQLRTKDQTVELTLSPGWFYCDADLVFGNSNGYYRFENNKLYLLVVDSQYRWALPPAMPKQTRQDDHMTLIVLERAAPVVEVKTEKE